MCAILCVTLVGKHRFVMEREAVLVDHSCSAERALGKL